MKRYLVAVAALSLAAALPARAQISFGAGGGISVPMGDLGDAVKSGYHGLVTVGFHAPLIPIGLRADGMYTVLGEKDSGGYGLKIGSVTANATFMLPGLIIRPYVIGGVGMYNSKVDVSGAESSNDVGINVGAGLRFKLSMLEAFAEARLHHVSGDNGSSNFAPVTVGIMF